jgi:hypothetical protein
MEESLGNINYKLLLKLFKKMENSVVLERFTEGIS